MNVQINGSDRSDVVSAEAAAAPVAPLAAHKLQNAGDEAAYHEELLRQLQQRYGVNLEPFAVPRSPGGLGSLMAAFKTRVWRFLRYQHEHVTTQQNNINQLLAATLESQHRAHQNECAALRRRIEELERKLDAR